MVEESGQLVAHSLTLHVVTDGGHAKRQERLHQQHAQPVAHLWEGQGRCPLLPPVRFPDQEPDRDQGQCHVLMPALPGPHLVRIHTCFPLASLEAGFNARSCYDDPRQFPQRWRLQVWLGYTSRGQIVMILMVGILVGSNIEKLAYGAT